MQTVQIENLKVTLGTGEEKMQDTQLSTPLREGIKVKEFKGVPIGYLNYRFSCTFKFSVAFMWTVLGWQL